MGQNIGGTADSTVKRLSSPTVVSVGGDENMSSDSENEEGLEERSPASDVDVKEGDEEREEGGGTENSAKTK